MNNTEYLRQHDVEARIQAAVIKVPLLRPTPATRATFDPWTSEADDLGAWTPD